MRAARALRCAGVVLGLAVGLGARDGDPCVSDADCAPDGLCVPGVPQPAPRGQFDPLPGLPELPSPGVCDVLNEAVPGPALPQMPRCPPGVFDESCLPRPDAAPPVPIPRDERPSPSEPRPPVTPPRGPECEDPDDPRCKT